MELNVLNLFLVLLAAWLGGLLASRLGYPSVLGELLTGILLGPPLLGLLHASNATGVLAELGVLLMMLYIGMEINPRSLLRSSREGGLAALGGFIVPFALGYWIVGMYGGGIEAQLFVGMAMGVTALATKSRILVDLNILDTRIASVMMTGALLTDTLSLIIFAGIISFAHAGSVDTVAIAEILVKVALFFLVSWFLGLMVFPRLYAWLTRRGLTGRTFNASLSLLIALAFAELAHLAGLHGILGAFVAGMLLRGAIAEQKLSHELSDLVKDVSLGFLAPIFFVTAGFSVSFDVFQTSLPLTLAVIFLATVGKILGTALFYLPSRHGWREGLTIGAGMNGRGAVEIVVAGIGLKAGIIDKEIYSILVFMAIATTATVPIFLKMGVAHLSRHGKLTRMVSDRTGVVIVGAGPVARLLGRELARSSSVVMIDANEENCRIAREEGLKVIAGDALEPRVLLDAGISSAGTIIGFTPNAEVNVLVAQQSRQEFFVPRLFALLVSEQDHGLFNHLERMGARSLFATSINLPEWDARLRNRQVIPFERTMNREEISELMQNLHAGTFLPLVINRGGERSIFSDGRDLDVGDIVVGLRIPPTMREHYPRQLRTAREYLSDPSALSSL